VKITLNGDSHDTTARTIAELVETLGLPAPTLLVEHNGTALRRDEWNERVLGEGDRVEMLRIAAGG
jgi:thiamine biosynthesis protein ThiS